MKNGTKPLDNNDLAKKQYTDEILGKLGEVLKKCYLKILIVDSQIFQA